MGKAEIFSEIEKMYNPWFKKERKKMGNLIIGNYFLNFCLNEDIAYPHEFNTLVAAFSFSV